MQQNGLDRGLSRRELLAALTAYLLSLAPAARSIAADGSQPVVRVGAVRGGTLSWVLDEIATQEFDRAAGVRVEAVALPRSEAGEAALRDRRVDIIVSDWFWVSRERSAGVADWTAAPFSSANGSIVVPPASSIRSLDDLKGRRVGVTGTSHDQAWTIIRLVAQRSGWDIQQEAHPEFGPPPEIASRLESGAFDAALLIWPWAARLEARGKARRVLSVAEAMRSLGLATSVPLLAYVFSEQWAMANPAAIGGFLHSAQAADQRLVASDEDWQRLMPLTGASDAAELEHLRDAFRAGIPKDWGVTKQQEAAKLFALVAEMLGDPQLTGQAKTVAPGTFFSPKAM
jgi:NitT/TauT family transport system substrate-binding protein